MPLAGTQHIAAVVGVAAKEPTTAQVRARAGQPGAANMAPWAVAVVAVLVLAVEKGVVAAAGPGHDQRVQVSRAAAGPAESIAVWIVEG